MEEKENKEWILINLKAATERWFLKSATTNFQNCKEK